MKKNLSALLIICTAATCLAQGEAKYRKLDSLLNYYTTNNKFMGSVSIREKDKVVFEKAYGYVDIENNIKADENTKYKIGSITKMFTAAIVFQLIEEKKLSLDTKLSKFYPDIKNAEVITIKNLLNHTSGVYNYTNDDEFMQYLRSPQTRKAMLKRIASYQPAFDPETTADYSNSNYLLLGYIIEDITGQRYKNVVKDRIIKKAGLKNTEYFDTIDPKQNEAYSYHFENNKWVMTEEWHESVAAAAGALQSTPTELTKFIRMLFEGKIVKKESLEEMMQTDYGYGKAIFAFPFGDRQFYGHNGGIDDFESVLGYYIKDETSISMIINGNNYDSNDVLIDILSVYYKLPFKFPNLATVEVNPDILKSYTGTYAASNVPLKINIMYEDGKLMAQATGQGAFPLSPVSETEYIFNQAGITINFTSKDSFTVTQGETFHTFTKEK